MVTEIELKAHVKNSEELRSLLSKKAEYLGAFEKEDTYWFGIPGLPPSGLRVRMEKRTLPDGRQESSTLATYKTKEVRDGIEINDEREFTVTPMPPFEEFLRRLGLKPGISKQKRGWAFSKTSEGDQKGITTELLEVEGLGWFLELEIVTGNKEETFAGEKKRLLDFLADLGIEREAIESRYYTEMLKGLNR